MSDFSIPPTQTPIAEENEQKRFLTNPQWLKWFIDVARLLSRAGGGSGSLQHNSLSGLQGGAANDYYHITSAQSTSLLGNQTANTVYSGPTTGAAVAPTFRALVVADIPVLPSSKIQGTATNDNAAAGYLGEYKESVISSATNFPTSTEFGDLTSLSLTAGDWDVTGMVWNLQNGSTCTECMMGISATSGNATTGLVNGSNWMVAPGPDGDNSTSSTVSSYRVSLSGTTTYYLKYQATYSAGQPQAYGRLSARRVR